jgi:hypothetical protein
MEHLGSSGWTSKHFTLHKLASLVALAACINTSRGLALNMELGDLLLSTIRVPSDAAGVKRLSFQAI